ncbi:Ldh family oxidoreductase [Amycolatopsis sp. NBC_00348]|uniref:Ldh family oxidoreductase n=1 Tax=Amycolatopsis sp. NBC_00348 TaxID=2975956 RepID=UPI002E26794C
MTTIDARRWHDPAEITQVATTALAAHGVAEAREVAEVLVETSLLGVHTHGVRLLGSYLDELRRSVATATPEIVIVKDTGPVVQVDAGDALGVVAALHGARLAVQRAKTHGVGLIGVRRSNHFGAAGCYARRIAAHGLVGLVTTSAAARVAPFNGVDPLLGTNPVALAYGDRFCLDMATSQVCFGEIKERGRADRALEPGWAVDVDGVGTLDASRARGLAPLGGYKGQGLGMAVTLLTAVLVGGPLDFEMAHVGTARHGRGVAHLLLAIDPEVLGGAEAATAALARLLDATQGSRAADPARPVLVPGDPQHRNRERQLAQGIELDAATIALLETLERDPR